MITKTTVTKLTFSLTMALLLARCGKTTDPANDSTSEIAAANISGSAQISEANGDYSAALLNPSILDKVRSLLLPEQVAFADSNQCPVIKTASCDGAVMTLTYNGCVYGNRDWVWQGSQIITFSSAAACQARSMDGLFLESGSLTRTFGGAIGNSPTTRTDGKLQVAFDTSTSYGYSSPVSGGITVNFGMDASNNNNPQRKISFNGIREVFSNTISSKVYWDHSISSDPNDPVVVDGYGSNRKVLSGTMILQHNLAKFTGTTKILSPLGFAVGCCHPVSGSIQTTFSGSKSGSEILEFESCGHAKLGAADGSSVEVGLKHCF